MQPTQGINITKSITKEIMLLLQLRLLQNVVTSRSSEYNNSFS